LTSTHPSLPYNFVVVIPVIEAVPNISEGRRTEVLKALSQAVTRVSDVFLLDQSADPSHNRCVLTIVGTANPLLDALLAIYDVASKDIDLRVHRGVHPRLGVVDVVPFVPLHDASMTDCVELARRLARAVAERFAVPVFLYGEAATRPERRALEMIRRGQFEGLTKKMANDVWRPDFGPSAPHPSAGASVVGAREPLIAFNVNLETDDVSAARAIARTIRERDGGLSGVKALGVRLEHRGLVQVSINLTDYETTPLHLVFGTVEREATQRGIGIVDTEIVGLVPMAAMAGVASDVLRLDPLSQNQVLETRLQSLAGPLPYHFGVAK
jgi:glutamate formiminotransferase